MPIIKTSYFPVCSFPDSALRTVMMQADGLQRNISSIRPLSPLKCLAILPFSPGDSQKWLTPWLLTQNSNHQNIFLSYLLFFFCSFRDIYLRAGFMFMFWVQSFRYFSALSYLRFPSHCVVVQRAVLPFWFRRSRLKPMKPLLILCEAGPSPSNIKHTGNGAKCWGTAVMVMVNPRPSKDPRGVNSLQITWGFEDSKVSCSFFWRFFFYKGIFLLKNNKSIS